MCKACKSVTPLVCGVQVLSLMRHTQGTLMAQPDRFLFENHSQHHGSGATGIKSSIHFSGGPRESHHQPGMVDVPSEGGHSLVPRVHNRILQDVHRVSNIGRKQSLGPSGASCWSWSGVSGTGASGQGSPPGALCLPSRHVCCRCQSDGDRREPDPERLPVGVPIWSLLAQNGQAFC